MNAKRCKRIRRALSDLPRAELRVKRIAVFDGFWPATFKYPEGSYQRVYRNVKRYS